MKKNKTLNIYKIQGKKVKLPNTSVISLFQKAAKSNQDRIAVVYDDSTFTYREIDQKSNSLSVLLRKRGVEKSDVVFNRTDNSVELLVSLLAILKCGAIYLPIDPLWPDAQTDDLIRRIKPKIIITNAEGKKSWQAEQLHFSVNELPLTKDFKVPVLNKKDPAYAFFTSGTTGIPKACLNSQQGILNRLMYMNERYKFTKNDVVLQNSNYMFDASLWQLLWPLINGAKVVIPVNYENLHPKTFSDLIYKHKITFTDFAPSIFKVLVEDISKNKNAHQKLNSIHQILVGGEAMNVKDVYEFKKMLPQANITNTYGPAECSIGTIFHEVVGEDFESMPIGKPINNVYALILNKHKKIINTIDQIGEIYLGGICIGLGYLGNKKETEKAFIANPFKEIKSEKLYKTGDLAHYDADGNICYIGRSDTQVKINGVRIELSSIENKIKNLNDVKEVFVFMSDLLNSKKELYLLATTTEKLNEVRLVAQLSKVLTLNLIPTHIKILDSMPHTQNAKINKTLLIKNAHTYFSA